MPRDDIKNALIAGMTIFAGYFPPAIAFGIVSKNGGLGLLDSVLFSSVVFAGASQFIALNLLMGGMGFGGIILTTLLVNFRHFLMSAYLSTRMERISPRWFFFVAFGVTDEVFSVLSFKKGSLSLAYILALQISAYFGWVSGTASGFILGGFLPEILSRSMGVALYALLLAIILPELKTSGRALVLFGAAGGLNAVLTKLNLLPGNWNIIVCIVVVALLGTFWPQSAPSEKRAEAGRG